MNVKLKTVMVRKMVKKRRGCAVKGQRVTIIYKDILFIPVGIADANGGPCVYRPALLAMLCLKSLAYNDKL